MRSPFALGLDFGTTNSALATVDASGAATVVPLPAPDGSSRRYWFIAVFFLYHKNRLEFFQKITHRS